MNIRMIMKTIGYLLMVEAGCMVPSLTVALINQQNDAKAFIISIVIIAFCGFVMSLIPAKNMTFYARDGFAIVSLGWILVSIFGALPFVFSGAIPSYVDAFFETVSGFTTTGSSILREIESLPKGILFWRSFTNWVGGMGVLVMMIAVLPATSANTMHIMKAESPGPDPGKLVPRIGRSSKILYLMYTGLTLVMIVLLLLGGMPLYDTLIHTFSTAGTGGFSIKNQSLGAYNNLYYELIVGIFMLLFGVNFTLYYQSLKGNLKSVIKDEELHFYFFTVIATVVLITWNLFGTVFDTVRESLRQAFFQVSSIITTTGFSTTDFNLWPSFSKALLVLLMFIGGCAGSTAGGLKCVRFVLLFKAVKHEVRKIIHPRSVNNIKYNGRTVEEHITSGVKTYIFIYLVIFSIAVLFISFDGFDMVSNFTAVAATINNIGPGFEIVGPMGNFADYSALSKIVLSFTMLFGRLEVYPLLVILAPAFWKKVNI